MPKPDAVELEGVDVIGETKMALKFRYDGKTRWIPKSAVDDDSEVYAEGDRGTMIIAGWYAEKEGLE